MEIPANELNVLFKKNLDFFMEIAKISNEHLIVHELWQILKLEEKLKPAFLDCEFVRHNQGIELFGEIRLKGKVIAHYENTLGGSITLKTFCSKKGERADILIKHSAIKLVEGYHRILDWHSIYRNGYVQNLGKNQWVLRFKPEIPTLEELNELLTELKN